MEWWTYCIGKKNHYLSLLKLFLIVISVVPVTLAILLVSQSAFNSCAALAIAAAAKDIGDSPVDPMDSVSSIILIAFALTIPFNPNAAQKRGT